MAFVNHAARIAHEIFQQGKFRRACNSIGFPVRVTVRLSRSSERSATVRVEGSVVCDPRRTSASTRGEQFDERERLGQ